MRGGNVFIYVMLVIAGGLIGAGAALHLRPAAPSPDSSKNQEMTVQLGKIETDVAEVAAALERLGKANIRSTAGEAALDELARVNESLATEKKGARALARELTAVRGVVARLEERCRQLEKLLRRPPGGLPEIPTPPGPLELDIQPPAEPQ